MIQRVQNTSLRRERRSMAEPLDIEPIEQVNGRGYSAAVQAYFAHYGLGLDGLAREHLFGTFASGDFTLAGHLYRPAAYRATVVLLHGYLNHSGQFKNLIGHLLNHGMAVGVFDLPGHGHSSGQRAAIDSFDQYARATRDFMAVVRRRLEGPYYTVGFSLGGAIAMDLLRAGSSPFEKTVLAAPLVHWTLYEQSKETYKVYSRFTERIKRFHQRNTSNRDYLVFNRTQDYLHCRSISLKWVKALFDWNERIAAMAPCETPLRVIQGDKDRTVDWRYNLNLIREKFLNVQIDLIAGARHELFNEADTFRAAALNHTVDYLTHSIQH